MTLHAGVVPRLLMVLALVFPVAVVLPTPQAQASTSAEEDFVQRINHERTRRGLHSLRVSGELRTVARSHSDTMASRSHLHHNPNLTTQVTNWQRVTENIGYGASVSNIHHAFMNSSGHRANILDSRVTEVGVGVTVRNSTIWVTQVYRLPIGEAPPTQVSNASGFSDVPAGHTFEADIISIAIADITRGCGGDRYCPARAVTRAEMATFLTRAAGLKPSTTSRFTDVPSTNVHRADINAIAAAGITAGCNPPKNDRFCPDDPVTRDQMASFLVRAKGLSPSSKNLFTDVPSTSPHLRDINALGGTSITRGCNPPRNTRYCPRDTVTRAQMAAFINRAFL